MAKRRRFRPGPDQRAPTHPEWLLKDLLNHVYSSSIDRAESITYLLIVALLTASSLAYLLSRLGSATGCQRTRSHHRASWGRPRAVLRHPDPDADHDRPRLPQDARSSGTPCCRRRCRSTPASACSC